MEDAATNYPLTVLIAGMGGQGVVLAGDTLAEAALLAGLNVKKSEIHGLSRRFGSVSCQVRIGRDLYSPLRGHGGVSTILSFEGYEGLKHLPFLQADGVALMNRLWSKPGALTPAEANTPSCVNDKRIEWFEGTALTHQAECPRSLNFFMLGVLSARLSIDAGAWQEALENLLSKRSLDVNREMFSAGRRVATAHMTPVPARQSAAAPRPTSRPSHAKHRVAEQAVGTTANGVG
ncbi:MAG: 2-oxoacid:acceptor oxidoreductase family protein [Planctomycetota bacterium]